MLRRPASIGLFAALPFLAGCMHFVHKPPGVDEYTWRPSDAAPDESKSCVFIFLIDPLDPLVAGDLTGVRDYVQKLGFGKTFYGQSCHASYFLEKMRAIHGHCDSARFVLIGYDRGADAARLLARHAQDAGLPVEVTIYLEPHQTEVDVLDVPMAADFTVRAEELVDAHGDGEAAKENAVKKSDVPTHPQTLALIERELTLLALMIPPRPRPEAPRVLLVPAMPPPRDTPSRPRPLPEEWQFLRPKNPREQPPPTLPAPAEPLPLPKIAPVLPIPKAKP